MSYLVLALVHAVPVILAGLTMRRWLLHIAAVTMCAVGLLSGSFVFALFDLGAVTIAWVGMTGLIDRKERRVGGGNMRPRIRQGELEELGTSRQELRLPLKHADQDDGTNHEAGARTESTGRPIAGSDRVHKQALPSGTQLHGYRLHGVLGAGGFGVTYLGGHASLGSVAIKEYMPNELAVREGRIVQPKSLVDREDFDWGLESFLNEAKTLEQFRHRNIVAVLDCFKANNTAYLVMEYEDGKPLDVLLKRDANVAFGRQRRRTLTQAQLNRVLRPMVDGLRQVHAAGFLHRDIKPANIFVRRSDESPVLLDFGSARQAVGRRSKSMTAIASAGYSPPEQYESDGAQGAWTDIYSLSALCYRAITGDTPIEAPRRQGELLRTGKDPLPKLANAGRKGYSPALLEAVDWGLRVIEAERPQTLDEWVRYWEKA